MNCTRPLQGLGCQWRALTHERPECSHFPGRKYARGTWLGLSHPQYLSVRGMFSCSVNGKTPQSRSVGSNQRPLELHRPSTAGQSQPCRKGTGVPLLGPGCPALPSAVWAPWCPCCPRVCPCVLSRSLFRTMPHPQVLLDTPPLAPALLHPCRTWDVEGKPLFSLGQCHSHQGTMNEDGQFPSVTMQRPEKI